MLETTLYGRRTSRLITLLVALFSVLFIFTGMSSVVYAQSLSVSPATGPAGTTVTVSGSGFPANTSYTVTFDGIPMASGTTDNGGWFSTRITVPPSSAPGSRVFTATAGTATANGSFFIPQADIDVYPLQGIVGTSVTVTGRSFPANTSYAVTFAERQIANGTTDGNGYFSQQVTIPSGYTPGLKVFMANAGGSSANRNFTIQQGSITVAPKDGPAGTKVTVEGAGFNYRSNITISLGNEQVSSATTSDSGKFTASFQLREYPAGEHKITAVDSYNNSAEAQTFKVTPTLKLTGSEQGTIGSEIRLSGTGFEANSSIRITLEGTGWEGLINSNPRGSFVDAKCILGEVAGGSRRIKAIDSSGLPPVYADKNFQVLPSISVEPTSGPVGTQIAIRGQGFLAGEKSVQIYIGSMRVPGDISINNVGSFDSKGLVPEMPGDTYTVTARDSRNFSVTAPSKLTVKPTVTLAETEGHVGKNVQFGCTGFKAKAAVRLTWDGAPFSPETVTTDEKGSFSGTLTVPKNKSGVHLITFSDGMNEDGVSWTMESDSPPVPVLLSPANGERVGHLGGQTPEFKWKAVSDPSGVSYDLSIAKDESFNNVVLTKTNLQNNIYTPSKKEALEKGNYYWRVRAIDGASNSSNWSNASTLQIGSNLLFWLLGISLSSLAGTAVFLRLFVGFTPVQRKAIAEARTTQNAKRAAQLEVEKTQRAELDRIEEQILEMARKNRGGLKIDSITVSLNIDPEMAQRCLKELKAYQEEEWYFFPKLEGIYKKGKLKR